jgi:hypothetical protein
MACTTYSWSKREQEEFLLTGQMPIEIFQLPMGMTFVMVAFTAWYCPSNIWSLGRALRMKTTKGVLHIFSESIFEIRQEFRPIRPMLIPSETFLETSPYLPYEDRHRIVFKDDMAMAFRWLRVSMAELYDSIFGFLGPHDSSHTIGAGEKAFVCGGYHHSLQEIIDACWDGRLIWGLRQDKHKLPLLLRQGFCRISAADIMKTYGRFDFYLPSCHT